MGKGDWEDSGLRRKNTEIRKCPFGNFARLRNDDVSHGYRDIPNETHHVGG